MSPAVLGDRAEQILLVPGPPDRVAQGSIPVEQPPKQGMGSNATARIVLAGYQPVLRLYGNASRDVALK